MIDFEYKVNADDVARAFRVLRKTEPDLIKAFKRDMKKELKTAAQAIASKYPSSPYLSGLGGFRRVRFDKARQSIRVRDNWVWSPVVGKVSVTPGKARKGVGRNNLVAIRMEYKGAIPWVTDLAKDTGDNLSPQGRALVRNIESRFPGWPRGGRIFYKEFMAQRQEVFGVAEKIMRKFIDDVNKVI